ncbi:MULTISPECIES: tetratricopeptide repeat protein [unclassified Colwellia]|uniref:tetratricopeptide repeat protein n=1 Tax=unclassified Colwellia TaxID=196834 RepID=UPI0015F3E650|nr:MULTISPECIES: tetratricopeptide repeat protein [unclassified Colwellia]MBA6379132.1 sel1 repeat family protein [Colwellia sp. BRX10-7]MBA6388844.1 sel1 repeat family protein [Colwellia sp. BRX10-2]MBA6403648.1 sel1 repeat family protein [Colwellia sp. BRX10-5]MBA6407390.1 sel1 repeat family protein [Colwellia sp. BRX10-1]
MKAILYVTFLLLSMGAASKDIKSPSNSELLTSYNNLKTKAFDGDINSQYDIFHLVSSNKPTLNEYLTEAFKFMIKAGAAGHTEAQFTIGSMYQTGDLLEKNSDVALEWLLEAAKKDHRNAQVFVGWIYSIKALDVTDEKEKNDNEKLAIYWFEKSITDKSLIAFKYYGLFLFMVDTFSPKAENFLSKVSESGDIEAMYWVGKMYAHRWSDNRGDYEFNLAHSWLEKAKLNGYKSQQFINCLNERKKNYLKRIAKENSK